MKKLKQLFEVDKIFLIPEQPGDFTGHADGMVRFVDEDTILINDYKNENKSFMQAFEIAIHNTRLDIIKIPYNLEGNRNNTQANGIYINYLEMENLIIIATFDKEEDGEAVEKFKNIFPGKVIASIDSNDIAEEGGILNCISWNIQK